MADILKYGWVHGGRNGFEAPLVNDEYFHRLGGAFVTASAGSGHMKMAGAWTDPVVGWAEVPRAAVPGTVDFWKSSATAGKDLVFVVTDPTAIFAMPVQEGSASLSASLIGRVVVATNSGSGSTYKQLLDATASSAAGLNGQGYMCTGVDLDNRIAYVRMLEYRNV